jgi:hypothetical protein
MNARYNSLLCVKWLKYLIFTVTAPIYLRVCFRDVNEANELMNIIL